MFCLVNFFFGSGSAINLNYGSRLSSYMNIFAAFKLYFLIKVSIFFDLSNFYR
jgi:hypothetical protein